MLINVYCVSCNKPQDVYMDQKTEKVYCKECNNEIANVNHFIKIQLKQLKKFQVKENKSFAFTCKKCGARDRPIKLNKDFACAYCKSSLNLPESHKIALKLFLDDADKEL